MLHVHLKAGSEKQEVLLLMEFLICSREAGVPPAARWAFKRKLLSLCSNNGQNFPTDYTGENGIITVILL